MTSDHGQPTQTFASIGFDIGKDVFHIVGFDAARCRHTHQPLAVCLTVTDLLDLARSLMRGDSSSAQKIRGRNRLGAPSSTHLKGERAK